MNALFSERSVLRDQVAPQVKGDLRCQQHGFDIPLCVWQPYLAGCSSSCLAATSITAVGMATVAVVIMMVVAITRIEIDGIMAAVIATEIGGIMMTVIAVGVIVAADGMGAIRLASSVVATSGRVSADHHQALIAGS